MSRPAQPPMLPRLARWMVVAVLCISLGLQWAMLQGAAWTGMLISFAREGSLIEAVTKTFDGKHPCALCNAVKKGQKQDQEQTVNKPMKKLEAVLATVVYLVAPAPTLVEFAPVTQSGERRTLAPPRTPPRQGLA
jgi:hypothetical protein